PAAAGAVFGAVRWATVDAVASVRKISNGNVRCNSSPWGARVDDRNMSGYFRRQVITATSASDGAAVRPSSLHGSIPVSVRTVLIRNLLAGWEGKSGDLFFTSWNRIGQWLRHVDGLRKRPEPSAAARACAI